METIEELRGYLEEMTAPGVWNRLLARGSAWSLMRQDGRLPEGAPNFAHVEHDLADYGFSVLRASLALREASQEHVVAARGFEHAARAFEHLTRNGSSQASERGFYRTLSAAAYHLGGYSAIAYSLFSQGGVGDNTTPSEDALALLILRDLPRLRSLARAWLSDEEHTDAGLSASLESGEVDADEAIATILHSSAWRAMALFDFALQTGDDRHLEGSIEVVNGALRLADHAANVPLWWVIRLCRSLLGDLWEHSLHRNIPLTPPLGAEEDYPQNRRMFIASLYGRRTSEVELWPSQREAARRSTDLTDDLVTALPTSAGKTRVAEIAALMALSTGKRVLIVTPLRALSAQTERAFRRTFAPLGFAVSSLYGASGVSEGDEDALRTRPIVIATPEKLDFALRSDPTLIDDVGLIVLDEGHLIGPSEREIRYEILVQRLLRRADAAERRIVCLSAILPEGEALADLTAWLRSDAPGEAIQSTWRPTRQRFGAITWQGRSARLTFGLNENPPFVARFVEELPARGRESRPYPRETKDLTLLAAWKFAAQGKRTLIFSTQANWVEGYGTCAVELVRRGYLESLVDDPAPLARALKIGEEWLGADHAAVKALQVGVAIHHGKLPSPFLRELEVLLSEGVLKVIVASPTLSQGLNLNAAVLLVPYLVRQGEMIKGEEFANVAGRAGRAFVDVEGLIAHVIYDRADYRLGKWRELVNSARARNLQSGLIQILSETITRLGESGVLDLPDALEYLANSREAWLGADGPAPAAAADDEEATEDNSLTELVEKLDATVFGLVEALDADSEDLPRLLDEALTGSLWARQVSREPDHVAESHRELLRARARLIWAHTTPLARRGHFAMGVGLESGLALDAMAEDLAALVDAADVAAIRRDAEALGDLLVELATRLLTIRPFAPVSGLPTGWGDTLRLWVAGAEVADIGADRMKMIEDAFAYRLVWALEAIRTRRLCMGWSPEVAAGGAAAAAETGVPSIMMAMLIRAGLPSRRAAIAALTDSEAAFWDTAGLKTWLESEEISELTRRGDWPTKETAALWARFREEMLGATAPAWRIRRYRRVLDLPSGQPRPPDGEYRVEIDADEQRAWVLTPDFKRLAPLRRRIRDPHPALYRATFLAGDGRAYIERLGPGAAEWEDAP